MAQGTITKIDKITNKIKALEVERKRLQNSLSQNILDLLTQNNALSYDFETLTGGLLQTLNTLSKNDDVSKIQQDLWKKEGASYPMKQKKMQNNKPTIVS